MPRTDEGVGRLNRENKKKLLDKNYYKHQPCTDSFTCKVCGELSANRIAADDNPMKLMSMAMKPIALPPFPVEKVEEMTRLMGGTNDYMS